MPTETDSNNVKLNDVVAKKVTDGTQKTEEIAAIKHVVPEHNKANAKHEETLKAEQELQKNRASYNPSKYPQQAKVVKKEVKSV